ncbi:LysM peptidoglycan-binding domain-containing protein [Jeotgalibacillus malaysiensis]|uniref:LysM peptidoglycan-binding domain-containing protein n=1 Tax=Jeotgalibacillus malaysiensis TaxID=1508404 RepID=UPI00384AB93F
MAKSKYEVWLSWQNQKEKLRLPVLPSRIQINNTAKNTSIDLADFGEFTKIQAASADVINFASFFPASGGSIVEYDNPPSPWECVETINRWKKSGRPIRLIVTGTPINYAVSIESFNIVEGDKDIGDIDFDISLKEYIFVTPKRIEIKQNKPKAVNNRPSDVQKSKTYTVKSGDTLWAIAGRAETYSKHSDWTKIWNANKSMLVKRDSRNLKKPGHYIFPGQKLVIP